jgi:hypothetical protein
MIRKIYEEYLTEEGNVAKVTALYIFGIPVYTSEKYTDNINVLKAFTQEVIKEEQTKVGFNYENKSQSTKQSM